jgi:hypothetical protein
MCYCPQQSTAVTIDPAAVAAGIAEVAEAVIPTGRAAAMLARAEEALNSGAVKKASTLLRATQGLAEKEAEDAKAAEDAKKPKEPVSPAPGAPATGNPDPTPDPAGKTP